MATVKTIIPIITGILGVILLITTLQNWSGEDKRFADEKEKMTADLNVATNNLVNGCVKTLPYNDSSCRNLRENVAASCKAAENTLDACHDNRVDQYYAGLNQVSTLGQNGMVSIDLPAQPTDLRCFRTPYAIGDASQPGQFMYVYNEIEGRDCQSSESSDLRYVQTLDLLRASAVQDETFTYYTEFHLLNGTILTRPIEQSVSSVNLGVHDDSMDSALPTAKDMRCGRITTVFISTGYGTAKTFDTLEEMEPKYCEDLKYQDFNPKPDYYDFNNPPAEIDKVSRLSE
jgi:hypothetical protein